MGRVVGAGGRPHDDRRTTMRSKGASIALAGTLALTGLAGGVVLGPALAAAATGEQSAADAVGNRVDRIKEALQGLVDDGTLTAEQRDRVATTLDEQLPRRGPGMAGRAGGPGGLGMAGRYLALDVAANTLGLTEQELLAELREGRSLADVAEDKGVPIDQLKADLQAAAEDRLAQAVEDGRITQEQADERKAGIAERIAEAVEREGRRGPGRGHGHGGGPGGRMGAPDGDGD